MDGSRPSDDAPIAVVLAGGAGTRLWPASTRARPKHLVPGLAPPPALGTGTLLEATLARIAPLVPRQRQRIVTVSTQADEVARVSGLPPAAILAEPEGRNTAAAVALAVRRLDASVTGAADPILVFLPADHHVARPDRFRAHLSAAIDRVTRDGDLLGTLGVLPTHPATGYGYIEVEAPPEAGTPVAGQRFVEKPSAQRAAEMIGSGRYLWNAGIFVGRRSTFARRLAEHAGATWQALSASDTDLATAYAGLPKLPFDVAVMERLGPGAFFVVPTDAGWSDVGNFRSLFEAAGGRPTTSVTTGASAARSVLLEADGNYVYADGPTVAVLGASGLAVVATSRGVLVCPLDRAEEVRRVVDALDDDDR